MSGRLTPAAGAVLWWERLPAAAGHVSLVLAAALRDGRYVRAWPVVAVLVPPAALAVGGALGALRPGSSVFTSSYSVLLALVVISAFGAGPGFYAFCGFVAADLVLGDHSGLPGLDQYYRPPVEELVRTLYAPLLLSYVLVWFLLVVGPLLALSLRLITAAPLRRWSPQVVVAVGCLVHAVVQVAVVFGWSHATAFLIRPLWSFSGRSPELDAIQPLQEGAVLLAGAAGLAVLARILVELAGQERLPPPEPARPPRPAPAWVRVPLQTALLTFLMSGLVDDLRQGVVLAAAIAAVAVLRLVLVPRLGRYTAAVARVPVLLRLTACLGAGYLLAGLIVTPRGQLGERSFSSMVVTLVASLALSALLLPPPAHRPEPSAAVPVRRRTGSAA